MSTPARATIRQVAERAGVSRMTVSNVMRSRSGKVSLETIERVLSAVRELEYVPVQQPTTQSRHVETRIISLVFDHIGVEDIWGLPTYRGMRESARMLGYDLLTLLRAPADWMLNQHELHFMDRRSDGLIFLVPMNRFRTLETLVQHRIPAVSCFTDDVPPGVATVVLDNAGAMRQATEYLLARGHRHILHLVGTSSRSDFKARRKGYEAAMHAAGLKPHCITMKKFADANWLPQVEDLLKSRSITAVVCANDNAAFSVMELARKLRVAVPEQLSIISMDDLPQAAQHGLTTFRFSCEDVGRYAVEAITRLIAGEDASDCSKVLPVELVERTSVSKPPVHRRSKSK